MLEAEMPAGEASEETGEVRGLSGLDEEMGELLISAVLVVAVMGRWGILMVTMGAVCSCGVSVGGEIFPCTNTDCSDWIKKKKLIKHLKIILTHTFISAIYFKGYCL